MISNQAITNSFGEFIYRDAISCNNNPSLLLAAESLSSVIADGSELSWNPRCAMPNQRAIACCFADQRRRCKSISKHFQAGRSLLGRLRKCAIELDQKSHAGRCRHAEQSYDAITANAYFQYGRHAPERWCQDDELVAEREGNTK